MEITAELIIAIMYNQKATVKGEPMDKLRDGEIAELLFGVKNALEEIENINKSLKPKQNGESKEKTGSGNDSRQ